MAVRNQVCLIHDAEQTRFSNMQSYCIVWPFVSEPWPCKKYQWRHWGELIKLCMVWPSISPYQDCWWRKKNLLWLNFSATYMSERASKTNLRRWNFARLTEVRKEGFQSYHLNKIKFTKPLYRLCDHAHRQYRRNDHAGLSGFSNKKMC